jgi:hypothetical protein
LFFFAWDVSCWGSFFFGSTDLTFAGFVSKMLQEMALSGWCCLYCQLRHGRHVKIFSWVYAVQFGLQKLSTLKTQQQQLVLAYRQIQINFHGFLWFFFGFLTDFCRMFWFLYGFLSCDGDNQYHSDSDDCYITLDNC